MADGIHLEQREEQKIESLKTQHNKGFKRADSFVQQINNGAEVFREAGKAEASIGATRESNVVHHQRKHPLPPEE